MNNPTMYVVVPPGTASDPSEWEIGLDADACKKQAKHIAEICRGIATVYKLVPVFEARLEVITNVLTKDLSAGEENENTGA
jgi:hypothetical protein